MHQVIYSLVYRLKQMSLNADVIDHCPYVFLVLNFIGIINRLMYLSFYI